MNTVARIGLGATLGLLALACSGGGINGGTGGTSGAGTGGTATGGTGTGGMGTGGTGTGGMGTGGTGTGGTAAGGTGGGRGGTGGYVAGDLELPACVKNLVAACPTGGTCTSEQTDGGSGSELCFASGVHATFSGAIVPRTVRVTKADDSLCYSFETSLVGGEKYLYTWKDAAGEVVATGSNTPFETPSFKIRCADGSDMKTCHNPATSPTTSCCELTDLGNATCVSPVSCSAGTCP